MPIVRYRLAPANTGQHNPFRDTGGARTSQKMTAFGIGPRLFALSLAYFAAMTALHFSNEDLFSMTRGHFVIFAVAGAALMAVGALFWLLGFLRIDAAFEEGRLLTDGVYACVRNPMYAGIIVFIFPGVALLLRSWLLLTVPVFAYVVCRFLIRDEERYLQQHFGRAYNEYRSRVNSLIPFIRLPRRARTP